MPLSRPIITLTTDFGQVDYYVAAMKAVLLQYCPDAQLVDVTHQVPPQDVLTGSIVLERAICSFPPGTTHLAVVDPGVGTSRRMLVMGIRDQVVVCPDNGLITWTIRRMQGAAQLPRLLGRSPMLKPAVRSRMEGPSFMSELVWRPPLVSRVFHGRDIMAPAAGRIARGDLIGTFTEPFHNPVLLNIALATSGRTGQIIHIDHFGNATSNIPQELTEHHQAAQIVAKGQNVGPLQQKYADVGIGQPLALIGSSGLLEIAVRDGSAAKVLGLRIHDPIELH